MTGSVAPSISGSDDITSVMFSVAHCSLVIIITCLSPVADCMNLVWRETLNPDWEVSMLAIGSGLHGPSRPRLTLIKISKVHCACRLGYPGILWSCC